MGGPGRLKAFGITRLLGGELIVTGAFDQTAVFGEGEENETWLVCGEEEPDAGPGDDGWCPFVAAYSDDGTLRWARELGYSCAVHYLPPFVAAAPDGGFAIAGGFVGAGVLGEGEPNETTIGPSLGDEFDIVVARYDGEGLLLWARQVVSDADNPWPQNSRDIFRAAFLDNGELVFFGTYNGTPVFGPGEPNETTLPAAYTHSFFISLFYPNGNLAWAMDQNGSDDSMNCSNSIAAYGDSTFYVGGGFGGEATFGTSAEDQKTMMSAGDSDLFLLRFDRIDEY
jgi:hypothetical protein